MKKKHNFRGKLVVGALLAFSIFVFNTNVYAEETSDNLIKTEPDASSCDKDFTNKDDVKKCKSAVKKCSNAVVNQVDKYKIENVKVTNNRVYFKVTKPTELTDGENLRIIDENGKELKSGSVLSSERFNSVTFTTDIKPKITFMGSDGEEKDIKCRGNFQKVYYFDSITSSSDNKFDNPACKTDSNKSKEGMCRKYLDGVKISGIDHDKYSYNAMKNKGATSKYSGFPEYFKTYFPYCDCDGSGKDTNYVMSDDDIKTRILSLAKAYEFEKLADESEINLQNNSPKIVFSPDAIILDENNPKNINQSFTCTAFGPQAHDLSGANGGFLLNSTKTGSLKYSVIKDEKTGEVIGYNNVRKFAKKGPIKEEKFNVVIGQDKNKNLKTKEEVACTVQCGEEVEVTYGPPVAVKGTVCFEYFVTVKSKIQCESKANVKARPQPPKVEEIKEKVCNVKITCNSVGGIVSAQAGPNEDFDNCVKTKFNGKYTQKAINYCYKKVYKKSKNNKMNNDLDTIIPKKVNNNCPWWNNENYLRDHSDDIIDGTIAGHTIDDVVEELKKSAKSGRISGYYSSAKGITFAMTWPVYTSNGYYDGKKEYVWKQTGGCYWDYYADFYKLDDKLVKNLVYDDKIFAAPKSTGNGCYDCGLSTCARNTAKRGQDYADARHVTKEYMQNRNDHTYYFADSIGAKRSHYIAGSTHGGMTYISNNCPETCHIYSKENDCEMPGTTIETKAVDKDAVKKYSLSIESYQAALKRCEAKAKCTEGTEKITTYTMGANQCTQIDANGKCTKWRGSKCTTRDKNGTCSDWNSSKICTNSQKIDGKDCKNEWDDESCVTWQETKEKDDNMQVKPDNSNFIILNDATGICYGANSNKYHYINRISFPGMWYDSGKKAVHRKPNCDEKDVLKFRKNAFCVDPDLPNINTKWWLWDQGNPNGDEESKKPRNQSWKNKEGNIKFDHSVEDTLGETYDRYAESDADYNISGKIKNFGYLGWNIDVSCFYAINNKPSCPDCPPTKTTCKDCPKYEENETRIENVEPKSISLDELFPSTDNSTKNENSNVKDVSSTKNEDEIIPKKLNNTKSDNIENIVKVADEKEGTGRTPGYNWTCDSTNTLIKSKSKNIQDYIVAPVALRKQIEKEGNSIINNKEELDYKIVLTTDNIRAIKNYNKGKKSGYYSFDGSVEDNLKDEKKKYTYNEKSIDIAFYKSNFLKNKDYISSIEKPEEFYCNNFKNGKCYNKNEFFKNSGCGKESE